MPSSQLDTTITARAVHESIVPLHGTPQDFDHLIASAATARYVLIGEASHGTHEFYRIRAEITKRLIRELGFNAVAVEADWPDAWRVNRFVHGESNDADATQALEGFRRFPQWMWRNADVLDFVGWLRAFNDSRSDDQRAGFYGLDLYSLHASMAAVLHFLDVVDPDAAARARNRYACFDHFGNDPQQYGYAAALRLAPTCEREVLDQLVELQRSLRAYVERDGRLLRDETFFAEQNARLVRNAERYYRMMFLTGESSWNYRDAHMAETLDLLARHLDTPHAPSRVVVWAHNSHLGDARATEMGRRGELNVGQLVRERVGSEARLIGFSTYTGSVTAADNWDEPAERMRVRPALPGSYEEVMHEVPQPNFYLDLRAPSAAIDALMEPRLQRAIGVIYRPRTERMSHYFMACLPEQFDALLHYDVTRAVEPLERTARWEAGELPETYPSAL
ncbi:MAG: erythromycin esterase family protein [Gemmatimonadaceae bacterium]